MPTLSAGALCDAGGSRAEKSSRPKHRATEAHHGGCLRTSRLGWSTMVCNLHCASARAHCCDRSPPTSQTLARCDRSPHSFPTVQTAGVIVEIEDTDLATDKQVRNALQMLRLHSKGQTPRGRSSGRMLTSCCRRVPTAQGQEIIKIEIVSGDTDLIGESAWCESGPDAVY